jgi:hypothetical protein
MSPSIIYLGLDGHKDSITLAVLPADAPAPPRVDRLPNDRPKLKRYVARLAAEGALRICYEASGAGCVLPRALRAWGYHCDVIAPSLIPTKPGVQLLRSRHYLLTFLARRGLVFRAGKHWTQAHRTWLRALAGPAAPLEAEDVEVLNE